MADIELMIKIPEEQYNLILKSDIGATSVFVSKEGMMYAIKNDTLLPEYHGDLVDRNYLIKKIEKCIYRVDRICADDIYYAPTIIPATAKTLLDKMEEEFGKDWDAPKQTTTEEKSCATCGQPRDYKGRCILFKEGKCVDIHEEWKPVTKEGTK